MAFYSLDDYKRLISSGRWSYFNERRAFKNLEKLDWSDQELIDVLLSLGPSNFNKTFPDQTVNDLPGYELVTADHYVVYWDEVEWCRRKYPLDCVIELSIKIAIVKTNDGDLAGVVNFHLSGTWD